MVCDSFTRSRAEVKAWVRTDACVLLRSSGGFDKAVSYQQMLAALTPLTPYSPLNTVLIIPDADEEILREMFTLFEEMAKAGGILRVRILFSSVHVLIQDATSDQ